MNEFKDIIKKYREEKKITKSTLSKLIGVAPSYITRLENGEKKNPSTDIKLKISKALDIPISELGINNISQLYVVPKPVINDIFPEIGKLKEEQKVHDTVEEFKFMANNVLLDEEKERIFKLVEYYNRVYYNDRYDLSKIDDDTYMDLRNMFYISIKTIIKNYQK